MRSCQRLLLLLLQVTDCRAFEGHREDILHMAALPEQHLLATGGRGGLSAGAAEPAQPESQASPWYPS
jgi:hypothetical protein